MSAIRSSRSALHPAATTQVQREFENECIELFGESVQLLGVPRSVGQIYGLLFTARRPLSFSDIVKRLEISKGSVSHGLQFLRCLGAIIQAGSDENMSETQRGVTYEPELSLRKLVSGVLHERVSPFAATSSARLVRLRALAERGESNDGFYSERTKQLNTWQRQLKTVVPLLSTLLGPKSRK